uniref:N-terminal acetyltransferase B complex subunit MDM20 homolog n=1 Tax=Romanomermis culicivorax TaxID=13658 RepID=A0A915JLF7_ROMCU
MQIKGVVLGKVDWILYVIDHIMNKNSAVIERRIRPIYDYLDIGNAKRALQEVEKLIRKQPDFLCAKILKALSLIRSGRISEADDILKTLDDLDTDDEFALQALTYCFRDLGRPDRIVQFYERALKKQPQNEEFLSHVMMAHCRTGQYKLQNQFAMQLYKLKPNKHYYYFWSIMATVMQGYENPEKRHVFLSLAEKMAEKSFKENKMTAAPEVMLYSMILEMLGKHSEAIDLLTSDLNKNLSVNKLDLNAKLIDLYVESRQFDDVFKLCEKMLSENLDEWLAWNHLIESGLSIIQSNNDLKTSTIDHITQVILSNIEKTSKSEQPSRGPFLARLMFIQRLLAKDLIPRSELGEPSALMFEYLKLFGHKPCAFMDLRPYLDLVNDSGINTFLGSLKQITTLDVTKEDNNLPENIKALRIHTCCLNIAWSLGVYDKLNSDKKLNFVSYLIHCYLSGLKYGNNLPPNDLQYSDDYLLIAAHFVWEVYQEKGDSNLIITFLSILEFALGKSQANFKFKLILAKIYAYVGCVDCLQETLQKLQIKYIMHETLW